MARIIYDPIAVCILGRLPPGSIIRPVTQINREIDVNTRLVLDAVEQGPITTKDLRSVTGLSSGDWGEAIAALINDEQIEFVPGEGHKAGTWRIK